MKSINRITRKAVMVSGLCLALIAVRGMAHAQSASVTINWNDTHQTIDGFGTSQGGDFAPYIFYWPEPQRTQILDLAFSQTNGIGLTIFRSQIRPSFSPTPFSYIYDADDDTEQVWMMKEAGYRGPVKLFASVWSPPYWMKTNSNIKGGSIDSAFYQHFADYLAHYAKEYASVNGVNIYAVGMSNEPDTVFTPPEDGWMTCAWTSSQTAFFLSNYLSWTFASRNISAKVIGPEAANWDAVESFLSGTYNNPTARARLDIVAGHVYEGDPSRPFQTALSLGKKIWQTEASIRHPVRTLDGALSWAKTIHDGLTGAQVSGWVWWLLGLYPGYDQNLIDLKTAPNYSINKAFWALGHFSKFIRPGFVRIGATDNMTLFDVSAYKDPATGQLVIVVINRSTTARSVRFNPVGFTAGYATPYLTSATQNLAAQPMVSLASPVIVPAESIVTYVSTPMSAFNGWANAPNARALAGDFNGDGRADIALAGGDEWNTIPVAFSQGDGKFSVTNAGRWDFALWANAPGVKVVVGDVNADGRDDLIATGGAGWYTIPVAYSNGDGTFNISNLENAYIPVWSQAEGVKVLAGDINNDGRDDLILTGGAGWWTIPVGFSNGNGTFNVTNWAVANFPTWAQDPYAKASATDVNADGRVDILLTSGAGWTTVPIALSLGNGNFSVTNQSVPNIPIWSEGVGAKLLTGCRRTVVHPTYPSAQRCDVNSDQRGDIVLTGGDSWITIPVGFSNGNGTFTVSNATLSEFPYWARDPYAKVVSGDFNGDRRTDLALVGGYEYAGSPRWTVPIAFSNGNGTFAVTNYPIN